MIEGDGGGDNCDCDGSVGGDSEDGGSNSSGDGYLTVAAVVFLSILSISAAT